MKTVADRHRLAA